MKENNRIDIDELTEKVLQGVKKAVRELIKASAANDEELIIGDKDGNIKSVPARELLRDLQQ